VYEPSSASNVCHLAVARERTLEFVGRLGRHEHGEHLLAVKGDLDADAFRIGHR